MWCKHCGQDVPAIQMVTPGSASCARCGGMFAREDGTAPSSRLADVAARGVDLSAAAPDSIGYPSFDDWEIDQNYRQLQARVGHWKRVGRPNKRGLRQAAFRDLRRMDAGHDLGAPHKRRSQSAVRSSFIGWTLLSLGLLAFVCGAALLGWSLVEHYFGLGNQADLWNLGMPPIVAGQVVLLLGLVLQLERISHNSRNAVRKLDQVGSQLNQLERNTKMLHVTHGSASQAFYAHMTEQANPEFLLADLKGQLDLLAMTMAKRSA